MALNRSDWIIIGISGVTCGGKTSLANRLKHTLSPVHVFHQDKYFFPDDSPKHIKCDGLEHNNYDILSALDMEAMHQDMCATLRGQDMEAMHQDMCATLRGQDMEATHQDMCATLRGQGKAHEAAKDNGQQKFTVQGKRFLIAEGFTVLNYKPIMDMCDLRYYFVLEYGECVMRRSHRLYDPPDVVGYFDTCVWPEHIKYRAEIEQEMRVKIIDGTQGNAFEIVMADLRAIHT